MENKYQITKTIRFGLTKKRIGKKHESHEVLDFLLKLSEEKIISVAGKASSEEEQFVKDVRNCLAQIKEYLKDWMQVYLRADQISLTKEYYRIIARKANFDGFWIEQRFNKKNNKKEEVKQPQTQLIKVSSLTKKYFDKPRKDYILDYWQSGLNEAVRLSREFEPMLVQYENALEFNDKAHTKPHLVDFRKEFLSICNLVCNTLVPLVNGSIVFDGIDKLSDEEKNNCVKDFASVEQRDERQFLLQLIEEIRAYFECNGGNVPFGRVTLNKYTAQQKPQNYTDEIKKIIRELRIDTLIKGLRNQDVENVAGYFQTQDKFKVIGNENKSLVERAQMFKCKPIPVSVRNPLAEFLADNYGLDKRKTLDILEKIGTPVSPAYDYSKLNSDEKKDFSLENYPIKLAFDYAWENLAREIKNSGVDFPKEEAKRYLKDHFDVTEETEELQLYARLLSIKEKIATLSNEGNENEVRDRAAIVAEIEDTFGEINYPHNQNAYKGYGDDILKWIKYSKEERKQLKKTDKKQYDNLKNRYEKARQEMGLLRGKQKGKISKYNDLTNKLFNKIAIDFGNNFAELRDKFREQSEINKISYCGIVVEDSNNDRYLLLQPINDKNDTAEHNDTKIFEANDGELTTYQVKSLTSKTLNKMIKNAVGYGDFHFCKKKINNYKAKTDWANYQDDTLFVEALKEILASSRMAQQQKWADFGWDFSACDSYDKIAKEVDRKGYILQKGSIAAKTVEDLVNNGNCLLLPIVNQDITSERRELKNQFSKDWQMIFDENLKEYRLHPEFSIIYRQPTPDYPCPGEKRYSRFQMIGGFQCEIVPQKDDFVPKSVQIKIFNDKDIQKKEVDAFNKKVNLGDKYYIIGIDRGIKQLATLCVLDSKGVIQGGFDIYTRTFNTEKKQWEHALLRKDGILDLSNLRVETTIDGKKVLVDLSAIETHKGENLQTVKLKQLAYIRKLQYQMQYAEDCVLTFFKNNPTEADIEKNIGDLITPYKEGSHYADLPTKQIKDMLEQFKTLCDEKRDKEKRELCELDAAENLKSGVVANMVGVVAYLVEKYEYKVYISLENLCRAYRYATDGLNGQTIPSTSQDPSVNFMEQENMVLAGVGTYRFFEMQLLKKLFKMQQGAEIRNLVPAFRSVDNYEKLVRHDTKDGDQYVNYPFGIVHFVDPKYTSQCCPWCDEKAKNKFSRHKGEDKNSLFCKACGISTAKGKEKQSDKYNKRIHLHLDLIRNGDDNGAYHIARKTLDNIKKNES